MMNIPIEFFAKQGFSKSDHYDVLILPFWKQKKPEPASGFGDLLKEASSALDSGDFEGKNGETVLLYSVSKLCKRILLLGLGDRGKVTQESLRRAFGSAARLCMSFKGNNVGVVLPEAHLPKHESSVRGIAEGLLLRNYQFLDLKNNSLDDSKPHFIARVSLIGASKTQIDEANGYAKVAEGVYLARDLSNGNADTVTAEFLAKSARDLAKRFSSIKTTVFDQKKLEKLGMGLILAVNRASTREPALIFIEYKGAPSSKDHTVLVGKGVTYDTGGLSLKPTDGMLTMKCDMGGAAVVLGTLLAAASLKLKTNITGVIPAVENCISSNSYKPGDVYPSYAGISVEIGNTDAEGRLILADALAYSAKNLNPTRIIDFATLTGSMAIALGSEATGMFASDDRLASAFFDAGERTFERVWRFPLFDEYRDPLKSEFADIKNIAGREGGAIFAAKFLQEFVDKKPWVHFDIAATSYLSEHKRYVPKFGTGVGVRLMVEFLKSLEG